MRRTPAVPKEMLPQAERAVRAFQKLQPTLDGFAQALTGRTDVRVQLGDRTQTDGKTIYLMPPFELGDEVEHNRSVCDDRDELDKLICPACDIREFILILIYHEISHLAFGSFDKVSIGQFVRTIGVTGLSPEIKRAVSERVLKEAAKMSDPAVQEMGSKINRFVPSMMNALEDVRVDTSMVKARPGTGIMHRSLKLRTLSGGLKLITGEVVDWSKLDANAQFTIATMALADGIDPSPYLDPAVMAVFRDERIMRLVNAASGAPTVAEASALAVETVIEAQRYGLFMTDNPAENYMELPEDEPEPDEAEPEEADEEDGELDGEGEDQDGSPESEGAGEAAEGSGGTGDTETGVGGGDTEEPSRDSDRDRDADRDDVDAPSADDDSEGADDTEQSGPEGEPDGEGEPDAGADGGESGDTDEAADEPVDGTGTGASGQPGGDTASDAPGHDSPTQPAAGSDEGDAARPEDRADASDSDDRGEADAFDRGEGEEAEAGDADDLGHSESDERLIRNALKELGFGDHHDVERAVNELVGHDEKLHEVHEDPIVRAIEEKAVETAHTYIEHFDAPSVMLTKVNVVKEPRHFPAMSRDTWGMPRGGDVQKAVGETILGPSLLRMRRALEDNQRTAKTPNKRSGRVNSRVLGRRAWSDDDRLFTKKTTPGKKDYAVLIGVDCSGSTYGDEINIEKEAAYAQAELCHRLGIKFAVYGHSGDGNELLIYEVKTFDQPWNPVALKKLNALGPVHMNLDGHTLQYYRKRLDEVRAMHKILMYYTDGAMPAENKVEELGILQHEIQVCKKQGHILMAVAVGCDDPKKYGMDTVRIDSKADVANVVTHLGKRIISL